MALIRIALLGPESTGKTTLCAQLAKHYKTTWVPEFARTYLDRRQGGYGFQDLARIAQGHLEQENNLAQQANKYLFIDTELVNLRVWSEWEFGKCDSWLKEAENKQKYDLYLLTRPDIPWQSDGLRKSPHLREMLFDQYRSCLEQKGCRFSIVDGLEARRFESCVRTINDFSPFEIGG